MKVQGTHIDISNVKNYVLNWNEAFRLDSFTIDMRIRYIGIRLKVKVRAL